MRRLQLPLRAGEADARLSRLDAADGSNGGNPCGFVITFKDGKKVYDAADTGLFGD